MSTIVNIYLSLTLLVPSMIYSFETEKNQSLDGQSSITFEALRGCEITPYLNILARLRLIFYQDYPYLYDGTLEEQEDYLQKYHGSEATLVVIAKKEDQLVGAILGLPLLESLDENKKVFQEIAISQEELFYLGDNIALDECTEEGMQNEMYSLFEAELRKQGKY